MLVAKSLFQGARRAGKERLGKYLRRRERRKGEKMAFLGIKNRKEREAEKEAALKSEFYRSVGFTLSSSQDAMSWEQILVDKTLRGLALLFQLACNKQRELMVLPEDKQPDLNTYHEKLVAAARSVETTKRDFWKAHRAAKEVGFAVKEKYTEYLPSTTAG